MEIAKNLAKALVKAQSMVEGAKKAKKNDHFRSKYADLASVWDACGEALSSNGLAVLQFPTEAPVGTVGLRTVILHESGESIEDRFFMPLKDPTNPQSAGSAITYARRYALMAALGISPEDDDGNAAAKPVAGVAVLGGGTPPMKQNPKAFQDMFDKAKDVEAMKAVYMELKNSSVDADVKTKMLSEMSKRIKETR